MRSKSKRHLGPKTRQLRFETMEERLYLSVTPCSGHAEDHDHAEETAAMMTTGSVESGVGSAHIQEGGERSLQEIFDQLREEGRFSREVEWVNSLGEIVRDTILTEEAEKAMGPIVVTHADSEIVQFAQQRQTSTVSIQKVQDGLFNSDREVVQNLVFEFERTADPDDPTALDQPLTIYCSYSVHHEFAETGFDSSDGRYKTRLSSSSLAVLYVQEITFQAGETKAYWEISRVSNTQYFVSILPDDSNIKPIDWDETVENTEKYLVDDQNGSSSGRVQLCRDNVDQAAPTIKVSTIHNGILDTEGNWIQKPVFEFERVIDPKAPESLRQPLTVNYVFFARETGFSTKIPAVFTGQEMSVTFRSGETKIQVRYDFPFDVPDDQTMCVDCVLVDSLPELYVTPQYHVGMNNSGRAEVTVADESRPTIKMKTVQEGAVSPNGQIRQSIVFEFERAHHPNRPEDLNQALTIDYELDLYQGVETDYRNEIAHLLDGPLSLTFQPGQTTVRLEFSGLGYNEYKSATSLTVRLLGTNGANPKVTTDTTYASSGISLVDNPGENSIPRVSVKVVPGAAPHGDKIFFEIERRVDPDDPHALDEPLEIRYDDKGGWYSDWGGFRGKGVTLEGRNPKSLIFQPGQSKIVLEYGRPGPDSWIEFKIFSPTGANKGPWLISDQPPELNTWTDYIVEQWIAEADYETPCTSAETAPKINVTKIQDGVIDAEGNVVQNPIFEFERVFHPSDADALNEPVTVNFHFQGPYSNFMGWVFGDHSITFQPGETTVRFEYDTQALLDSGLTVREMTCTLGDSESGLVVEKSQHYHAGNRYAKLKIVDAEPSLEESPIFTISGPAEDELFERSSGYWDVSAQTQRTRPIMNWEINWGDGSENTEIRGGPRNRIQADHYFCNAGTYTVTLKTTDIRGYVTTTVLGTYTVKPGAAEPPATTDPALKEPEAEALRTPSQESLAVPADTTVASPTLSDETPVIEATNSLQASSFAEDNFAIYSVPVTYSTNRIAEIDLLFRLEQSSGETIFGDSVSSADLPFDETWNAIASFEPDAVFATDENPFALLRHSQILPEVL